MSNHHVLDEPLAEDLRAAFAAMTDGLVPANGDADHMVRAGRSRLQRRRAVTTVAAVAASVALGAGGATLTTAVPNPRSMVGAPSAEPSPAFSQGPYADLYRQPTRGDLADDVEYQAKVISTWNDSHGKGNMSLTSGLFDDLRGEPHVVWAGTTPAGQAAIVAQPAWWAQRGPHKSSDELMVTLVGLIGVDEHGDPKLIADDYQPISAWFVDPSLTTLVVADLGVPVSYTAGWTYRADGSRYLKPIPVRFHDGAAVITLAKDVDVCAVQLAMPESAPGPTDLAGAKDWNTYCQRVGAAGATGTVAR